MIKIDIYNKEFSDRVLLEDTSLVIKKGDFIVITGPSGAGKTSLLNIIGCLDFDFEGDYFVFGNKINHSNKRDMIETRRKYFSYIFQDSLINDRQSILRNVKSSLSFTSIIDNTTVGRLLADVGLNMDLNTKAAFLSGGEKQRLALARALLKDPLVILADEPTASLDVDNKNLIMNILKNINSKGVTVVMVTHDLNLIKSDFTCYHITDRKISYTRNSPLI